MRKSINYTEPKRTAPQKRFRFESSSSEGSEEERNEDYTANSEDEQEKDLELCEDINSETEQRHFATMEAELLREMQDEIKVLRVQLNLVSSATTNSQRVGTNTPTRGYKHTQKSPIS